MDFGDLGNRCSMEFCQQQDFLPFKCEFCQDIFCANHRRPDDHKCKNSQLDADDNYVMICPKCKATLSLKGLAAQGMTYEQLW